ncbi:P-loop containing nucleoside triphosphate hydrolase protein [Emericellopsis atlantica]|uniref:P-loop containing nucleoside triphosphate hydrolase protein n=1 Tax=Emericellopsis atlantica TaxID=2614577 RepID=A0A9P8CKK7_9HYPO|nr:P-loop containing nucleoside triphosphate hydrolase protein [Emericellopsis atlantica]KAG9250152.1 P-loop containing nucleoside triphosphate hydrolase protein [Emericellopsis atlantica]
MAPRKRTHDDGGDTIEEVVEATSALRPESSRKRARVSINVQDKDQGPVDDESLASEDEDEDEELSNAPQSPPQTQYEFERDAGFHHLENIEYDDFRATQAIRRQREKQVGQNAAAESGIIESVTCINFMCHTRLHVELGPLINFVVGENGSGKSAVLTAITLCLGGKASDTNRGGSLRSFVRAGQEHGQLIVRIKNAGTDAYQPDLYGDTITIERHFSKSGTSGFKIKSAAEKVISTKKQEVDEISEWYALQISNPLTVLSQDNARQFLNSASPAQKYKYFISGVQLEQLDNDYKMSRDTLDRTEQLSDELKDRIAILKKEMDEALRQAELAKQNGDLRAKARFLRSQLAWVQVLEQENILKQKIEILAEREQRVLEAEQARDTNSQNLEDLDQQIARAEQVREEVVAEGATFSQKVAAAEEILEKAKRELADIHQEERAAHTRLKNAGDHVNKTKDLIQQEEERLSESTGPERAQKDSELNNAKTREEEIRKQQSLANERTPALKEAVNVAERTFQEADKLFNAKRKETLEAKNHRDALMENSGGAMDGYSDTMKRIVDAIHNDGTFAHKPVGPLGSLIRLKQPEWSKILEKTLGDTLNGFVVRSKGDQTKLSRLIGRYTDKPPPIFISNQGHLDTAANEPDEDFDTILRVMEFDDDTVRTQLIMNASVEKIILVKDRVRAQQVMFNQAPPRNVGACICLHDGANKRNHGLRLTNRGGNKSTSPISPPENRPGAIVSGQPRMRTDIKRQVALQQEIVKQLGQDLIAMTHKQKDAKKALVNAQNEKEGNNQAIQNLAREIRQAQADIQRIEEELDQFEGADDRLETLRATLREHNEEAEQVGMQYGNMRLQKETLSDKVREEKKKVEALKEEGKDFQARVNKAEGKVRGLNDARKVAVSSKNAAYDQAAMAVQERDRAEVKRQQYVNQVAEYTEEAEKVCQERPPIPDGETRQNLEKRFKKIKEQLAAREKRFGGSDEELFARRDEAVKRYEDIKTQAQDVEETIVSLKRAMGRRLEIWRQFQRQISARVRNQFTIVLSERGFRGGIELDHKNRKIHLRVEPDETRKSDAGRNTKTLSGGEKSFTSICMLLAIWEAVSSPIRCLDEFDVFMDNVNRAMSTNLLCDAARRSVSRQYILITPNAIEGRARMDKDVNIIR